MPIVENINNIKDSLPQNVKLVLITKNQSLQKLEEAYESGHRIFGENKAQELIQKQPQLPSDIEWHFVGHLQTNKVKYIVPFIKMIHSVDSFKLLKEINKESLKCQHITDCLLQFHIASEDTKFGLSYEEAEAILSSDTFKTMENIQICGVMGMATFTDNSQIVKKEFMYLKEIFETLKTKYFSKSLSFTEISMGMTDDYKIAIACGSTIIRIGTAIFGSRIF